MSQPEPGSAAQTETIRKALEIVIDPEIGRNVIDIGLIYAIRNDIDGNVAVTMTTTTRGCPATGFLVDAVRSCVEAIEGVGNVDVLLTYDPPWTPDRMAG
jgi:metal-sulfur cluster biosynthetic enzyme